MGTNRKTKSALPMGEQPLVEGVSGGAIMADTFAGCIHVEWDNSARGYFCICFVSGTTLGYSNFSGRMNFL
jgi:hypothetical protein